MRVECRVLGWVSCECGGTLVWRCRMSFWVLRGLKIGRCVWELCPEEEAFICLLSALRRPRKCGRGIGLDWGRLGWEATCRSRIRSWLPEYVDFYLLNEHSAVIFHKRYDFASVWLFDIFQNQTQQFARRFTHFSSFLAQKRHQFTDTLAV